jgi:hypothetical protein
MNRLLGLMLAAWLAVTAAAVVGATPVLADDPGTAASRATTSTDYDIGAEPLMPYVAALLVVSAGLSVVGFVGLWAQRPRATRRPAPAPDAPRAQDGASSGSGPA